MQFGDTLRLSCVQRRPTDGKAAGVADAGLAMPWLVGAKVILGPHIALFVGTPWVSQCFVL